MIENMHIDDQPRHLESLDEVKRVDEKTEPDDYVDLKNELVSEVRLLSFVGINHHTNEYDSRLPLMLRDTKSILRA